ncbi:MAG: hypothetical protein AB2A00_36605 [Myxococcota bacterium]
MSTSLRLPNILVLGVALLAPALLRAEAPYVMDARVVTSETGRAERVEVRVLGGVQPVTGKLYLARAGEAFQEVELRPGASEGWLVAEVPEGYQARPFGYYVTIADAEGLTANSGSPSEPRFHAPDEPPVPDGTGAAAPPATTEEAPSLPPSAPPAAPESAPQAAPEPPHPPAASTEAEPRVQKRRRVRTQRVVECCGIPIWGGGRNPLFLIGALTAGALSLLSAGISVLFLIDLGQAQSMVRALSRAEDRGYRMPSNCTNWGQCREKYDRALIGDVVGLVLSALATLGLGTAAFALLILGSAIRTE